MRRYIWYKMGKRKKKWKMLKKLFNTRAILLLANTTWSKSSRRLWIKRLKINKRVFPRKNGNVIIQVQKIFTTWRWIRSHASLPEFIRIEKKFTSKFRIRWSSSAQHTYSLCLQTWNETSNTRFSQRPRYIINHICIRRSFVWNKIKAKKFHNRNFAFFSLKDNF